MCRGGMVIGLRGSRGSGYAATSGRPSSGEYAVLPSPVPGVLCGVGAVRSSGGCALLAGQRITTHRLLQELLLHGGDVYRGKPCRLRLLSADTAFAPYPHHCSCPPYEKRGRTGDPSELIVLYSSTLSGSHCTCAILTATLTATSFPFWYRICTFVSGKGAPLFKSVFLKRLESEHEQAISQVLSSGKIKRRDRSVFWVTLPGFVVLAGSTFLP